MKNKFFLIIASVTALLLCAALFSAFYVSAEPQLLGGIDRIELTIPHEPGIGSSGSPVDNSLVNYSKVEFEAATESTRYEVCPIEVGSFGNVEYASHFKNGVAWYDLTDKRYLNPNIEKDKSFQLLHEYRVEIVVGITGELVSANKPNYSALFRIYGEGDEVEPAVSAAVNGLEATVSRYKEYDVWQILLVSYTFGTTLPKNGEIQVVEACIDAPRGGRKASFYADVGDYTGRTKYQTGYSVRTNLNSGNTVKGVSWYDETTKTYLKDGDTFVTGHSYSVEISLVIDYNDKFVPKKAFLNGSKADYGFTGDSKYCSVKRTFESIREAPTDYVSFQVYGIAGPIAGATPENYPHVRVTCDESAGSNVEIRPTSKGAYYNDVCWIDAETYSPVSFDEEFVKGKKYTLIVPVRVTGDNLFSTREEDGEKKSDMWATFIPDIGEEEISTYIIAPTNRPDHEVDMYIRFDPCKALIEDVGFTVQEPKEEVASSLNVTTDDMTKYRARNAKWYDSTAGRTLASGEKFVADHEYQIVFEVYVAPGSSYMFPAGKGLMNAEGRFVKVNGNRDGVISYSSTVLSATTDKPWEKFYVVCDMGVCNDSVIEEIALQIAPPVAGEKPHYTAVNLGSGYAFSGVDKNERWSEKYYMRGGIMWRDDSEGGPEYFYETDTFTVGRSYTAIFDVNADDGYEFSNTKYDGITAIAKVNGNAAEIVYRSDGSNTRVRVQYTFVCEEAHTVTVSGLVRSADSPAVTTYVRLYRSGYPEPEFEKAIAGTAAKYSFSGVRTGSYTLQVAKEGYVTENRTVIVNDSDVTENFVLTKKTVLWGDANGDGDVTAVDIVRLKKYLANNGIEINENADANGDGKVDSLDVVRLKKYFAEYDHKSERSSVRLG